MGGFCLRNWAGTFMMSIVCVGWQVVVEVECLAVRGVAGRCKGQLQELDGVPAVDVCWFVGRLNRCSSAGATSPPL